jgi:AcrR family transcriptional regulator
MARPRTKWVDNLSREGYLSDLPPVAQSLLTTAKRLLGEGGFSALTLEAIAEQSGENKAMIRYYFGDKAGLIASVVDALVHDATVSLLETTEKLPVGPDRIHAHLEGARQVMETPGFNMIFDVLPHAMRDPRLQARLAELYKWYREVNVESLGVNVTADNQVLVANIASLLVAATDGLAVQRSLDSGFDTKPVFSLLEALLRTCLDWAASPPVERRPAQMQALGGQAPVGSSAVTV